jgi:hypothetical protein
MAWYESALTKPGDKKCPHCGRPQGWDCFWRGVLPWWRCSTCRSALTVDGRRSALIWALYIPLLLAWSVVLRLTDPSWPVTLIEASTLIAIVYLALWWLQSCKLKSTVK